MSDVFGNSQFDLSQMGAEASKQISKNRAIIEQKEKGDDMAKTVGETKVFMSAHGIANALKPVNPRIKKLVNRKIGDFKQKASDKIGEFAKSAKESISDFIAGDGGKSRRLKEFQQQQEEDNASESFSDAKDRFNNLDEDSQSAIRKRLNNDSEFSEPDYDDVSSLKDFRAVDKQTRAKFNNLDDDSKDKIKENMDNNPDIKTQAEIKQIKDPEEQLTERIKRSKEVNNQVNEANPEQETAMKQNTQILKDQVSEAESKNFAQNEAKRNQPVAGEQAEGADGIELKDVADFGKNTSNFAKTGEDMTKDSVEDIAKKTVKTEAKQMAKSTVEKEAVEETAGEVGGAALDAIPGADVVGAIIGGVIAIKKAIQVKRLEKQDEGLVASKPITGVLQQVGV